jgi:hypothetical protein
MSKLVSNSEWIIWIPYSSYHDFLVIRILKSYPLCCSLRVPRGTCQVERARAPPRVNFARNSLNSSKNIDPNRWTLTLSISPLRPPRRRALSVPPLRRHLPSPSPSSTPPPPLTFSLSGCSSSPLPMLRRLSPAYSHRIQIRREARLGVGATAPLLELREPRCGNLSLSACLNRFSAPSSRSEEGLAAPCQHKRCRRDQRGLAISVVRSRARARERRGIDPAPLRRQGKEEGGLDRHDGGAQGRLASLSWTSFPTPSTRWAAHSPHRFTWFLFLRHVVLLLFLSSKLVNQNVDNKGMQIFLC